MDINSTTHVSRMQGLRQRKGQGTMKDGEKKKDADHSCRTNHQSSIEYKQINNDGDGQKKSRPTCGVCGGSGVKNREIQGRDTEYR